MLTKPVQEVEGNELPSMIVYHTNWAKALQPLKEKPGKWFLIKDEMAKYNAQAYQRSLRLRLYKSCPTGNFEFATRQAEGSETWNLYGKFLSEE